MQKSFNNQVIVIYHGNYHFCFPIVGCHSYNCTKTRRYNSPCMLCHDVCLGHNIQRYLQWCFFVLHYAYMCSSEGCSQEGKEKGTCIVDNTQEHTIQASYPSFSQKLAGGKIGGLCALGIDMSLFHVQCTYSLHRFPLSFLSSTVSASPSSGRCTANNTVCDPHVG